MVKIFGREQAVWLQLIAAVFTVLMGYGVDMSGHVQGVVTAVVVFAFSVVTAVHNHDGVVAMATGIAVAGFSLLSAFGWDWSQEHQANVLALITVVGGFVMRQLTTNPVPASVSPAGALVASGRHAE
jgi:hypothetical protein